MDFLESEEVNWLRKRELLHKVFFCLKKSIKFQLLSLLSIF